MVEVELCDLVLELITQCTVYEYDPHLVPFFIPLSHPCPIGGPSFLLGPRLSLYFLELRTRSRFPYLLTCLAHDVSPNRGSSGNFVLTWPDPPPIYPARPTWPGPALPQYNAGVTVPDCFGPERYVPRPSPRWALWPFNHHLLHKIWKSLWKSAVSILCFLKIWFWFISDIFITPNCTLIAPATYGALNRHMECCQMTFLLWH